MSSAPLFCAADAQFGARSAMAAFRALASRVAGKPLMDAAALQEFSLDQPRLFWRCVFDHARWLHDGDAREVRIGDAVETARFFPHVRLSYAENLLRDDVAPDTAPAVIGHDEDGHRTAITRGELRASVLRLAGALRGLGIGPGDTVACISGNRPEAVLACLATTALGACWSSVAPDLGAEATTERFAQLQPKLLFAIPRHRHHGAERDLRPRITALAKGLTSLRHLVALQEPLQLSDVALPECALGDLVAAGPALASFPRFPFDHPLCVLFSSGTTGKPKGIVHGTGGTLLEHGKELLLHSAFTADDTLYFHTTCGWMMWNWQLSALACGTSLVLLDGSVSHPTPDALLRLLQQERVTVFGTSPAYLQYLAISGIEPKDLGPWPHLRAIQSTGSVLFPAQYEWTREHWAHVPIQSISGGTDILGCFVLGHPELPVHLGESQCISLGLDVRALDGDHAQRVGSGELVCANPFPSRPVRFLDDADGSRYHAAYFAQHAGLWTHGDFVELTARGTARVLGRSDGTLNVKGVRIGPAEIYAIVQGFPEVLDCMALEQRAPHELGGSRLVLLVVLAAGQTLARPLTLKLKKALHDKGSPNHVPSVVAQVSGLPTTFSGKKSERAATDALHGREVKNRDALKNPDTLAEIAAHPDLRVATE